MFVWRCDVVSTVTYNWIQLAANKQQQKLDGSIGQVVVVGGGWSRGGVGAGVGARQQRQKHPPARAAPCRRARTSGAGARRANCRPRTETLPKWGRLVQRVGRVGRTAAPRAVGAPLSARARCHLRCRRRRPLAARGGARGAGADAGAPGHVRAARATAGVRQQERCAARARADAGRRRVVPRARRGPALAHLRLVRAQRRRARRRCRLARPTAARRTGVAAATLDTPTGVTDTPTLVY